MNRLEKLQKRHGKEFSRIPKFYAFSNKQFEEQYKLFQEMHPEVIGEPLVAIVDGCFTTEKYYHELADLSEVHKQEVQDLLKDDLNLFANACYKEFCDREFYLSDEDDDQIIQLVYYKNYKDLTRDEKFAYDAAREVYFEDMREL